MPANSHIIENEIIAVMVPELYDAIKSKIMINI